MGSEAEHARCRDAGVLILECSRAGVAGVHEGLITRSLAFPVDACELGLWDEDLAADLDDLGRPLQPERELPDGPNRVRDIIAPASVAPGQCTHERPPFVAE